jgi:deoxyuridine 5'-triphosphate nucleotidohydrolase
MIKLKIKPNHNNFKAPIKGSKDAACYDVYAAEITTDVDKQGQQHVIVDLGFQTEFDPKYEGVIRPRSNMATKNWVITNSPGTIDADYRDNWKVIFTPIPFIDYSGRVRYPEFPYKVGERVAQISLQKVREINFDFVTLLSETDRTGGFGSTGTK